MLVYVIGVGGTGSSLVPLLTRMLDDSKFVLFDGDIVEDKNISRQVYQSFNLGENKAVALARKLNSNFSNEHYYFDKYIESEYDLSSFLGLRRYEEKMIIIGCVDNNATRKIIETFYDKVADDKCIYIDAGNEDTYGNVFVSTKKNKIYRTFYVETLGDHPSKNCSLEIALGNPQQYQLNFDMALSIAKVVFNYEQNQRIPSRIEIKGFSRKAYFD